VVVHQGERVEALRSGNRGGRNWSERITQLMEQLHVSSHEIEGINKLKLELKYSKMELKKVTTLVEH
jgi:hypothetical protein